MALEGTLPLSIKNQSGYNRNIAQEVDGNNIGDKSLWTLGVTAGFQSGGVAMSEFIGFGTVHYSATAGTGTCQPYPDVGGFLWNNSFAISINGLPMSNLVNVSFKFKTLLSNNNITNSANYYVTSVIYKNSVSSGTYNVSGGIPNGSTTVPDQTVTLTNVDYNDILSLSLEMYGDESGVPPWENGWSVIHNVELTITPVSGYPIRLVDDGSWIGGQVACF